MGKGASMSRNFGIGSRDMGRAGQMVLDRAAASGDASFSTAATNTERWSDFCGWAKEQGVKKMEDVTPEVVRGYGEGLASRVAAGQLAPATAQNRVSAINGVMSLATRGVWHSVSPTRDCGIPQRCAVRSDVPGALDRSAYGRALEQVREKLGERAAAVVELAREFGLRSKEASLIDARGALSEAQRTNSVTVSAGTKGGLERSVPIKSTTQLAVLERAAQAQGNARAVMAPDTNWKGWRGSELREARDAVQGATGGGLHDLRAAYACTRYETLTGHAAPCAGGAIYDKGVDALARLEIANELGHGRIDVVSAYVGSRR
jgi:hypothetical protein